MLFEVDGPEEDEEDDDELLLAKGDGLLVLIDGKRLGRGDMGAIGGCADDDPDDRCVG